MKVLYVGPGLIVSGPDAVGQTVVVGGKTVHFDYCRHSGPLVTDKEGQPLARQPVAENHPFWAPFNAWLAAYHREHPGG